MILSEAPMLPHPWQGLISRLFLITSLQLLFTS